MPTYTLLYAALKNMGDFLIYERSKELLRAHKGMVDHIEFHGLRESLDAHLDEINQTRALIICGGPGMVYNMWPRKYPLASELDTIKVPIIVLGSGWSGMPGDGASLAEYGFNATTHRLFERINREGHDISVRDFLTQQALRRNGIDNVVMTGCPAWYDLAHLDEDFDPPSTITTAAFTPPANRAYASQAVEVMKVLRALLPDARLICAFHRGLKADAFTSAAEIAWVSPLADHARELGYEIRDASSGLENIDFYQECDLHVGYRVHGHLYFLAKRRPSLLIHEDGRGRGASEALGLPGVQGWNRSLAGRVAARLRQPKLTAFLQARDVLIVGNPSVPENVRAMLTTELDSGFASYRGLPAVFRRHYKGMVRFLESIP